MREEWTDRAKWQRDQITDYIYEQFGECRALKFLDDIDEAVDMILRYPNSGAIDPLFADRSVTYRSVIVGGMSKMVYRIEGDVIYIAAVWDCRCEPEAMADQVK